MDPQQRSPLAKLSVFGLSGGLEFFRTNHPKQRQNMEFPFVIGVVPVQHMHRYAAD